jgi:hypothetical protein
MVSTRPGADYVAPGKKAFQKTKEVVAEKQVLLDEMEMKKTKEIEGGCDESQIVQHCRSHRVARL